MIVDDHIDLPYNRNHCVTARYVLMAAATTLLLLAKATQTQFGPKFFHN